MSSMRIGASLNSYKKDKSMNVFLTMDAFSLQHRSSTFFKSDSKWRSFSIFGNWTLKIIIYDSIFIICFKKNQKGKEAKGFYLGVFIFTKDNMYTNQSAPQNLYPHRLSSITINNEFSINGMEMDGLDLDYFRLVVGFNTYHTV